LDSVQGAVKVPAIKNGDSTIFSSDSIEILLETPTHSYYQIAFDPKGHYIDLDRIRGVNMKWGSGLKMATFQGKDYWTVEVRVPVAGASQEELNPDFGVSGDKPGKDSPWYFNVCRVRKRKDKMELSAFSPTLAKHFHKVMKFGKLEPNRGR